MRLNQCFPKLRAIALLRWAGVDPLGKAPEYGDWDAPEEEWAGFPAQRISHAKKAGDILKLLKLRPSVAQWFKLLEDAVVFGDKHLEDFWTLHDDPERALKQHPKRASKMIRDLLRSLCWGWHYYPERDRRLAEFCIKLLDLGVALVWRDKSDIASLRRQVYRSDRRDEVFRVLSKAAEGASSRSRKDLVELVRTPKMRELVITHDAMILVNLGLGGPASYGITGSRTSGSSQRPCKRIGPVRETAKDHIPSEPVPVAPSEPPRREKSVKKLGHTIARPGSKVLTREKIYADVWASPASHVAIDYGISGSMLARICSKMNIPRPPRGYWASAKTGRKGKKPSLPKWNGDGDGTWAINPVNVKAQSRIRHHSD